MILEEKNLKLPKTVVTYFLRPLANTFRSKQISWVGNEIVIQSFLENNKSDNSWDPKVIKAYEKRGYVIKLCLRGKKQYLKNMYLMKHLLLQNFWALFKLVNTFFLSVYFSVDESLDIVEEEANPNSSLARPLSSWTLRHYPGNYWRKLTSAHS